MVFQDDSSSSSSSEEDDDDESDSDSVQSVRRSFDQRAHTQPQGSKKNGNKNGNKNGSRNGNGQKEGEENRKSGFFLLNFLIAFYSTLFCFFHFILIY